MHVSCPKCFVALPVEGLPEDDGKVRVHCRNCGAGVLVKLNRRELKLSADIPITNRSDLGAITDDILSITSASGSFPPVELEGAPSSGGSEGVESIVGLSPWAVIIDAGAGVSADTARNALRTLPRFRREPNRMSTLDGPPPWIFAGITKKEATFVAEKMAELGARARCDVENNLLDESGVPLPPIEVTEPEEEAFDGEEGADDSWGGDMMGNASSPVPAEVAPNPPERPPPGVDAPKIPLMAPRLGKAAPKGEVQLLTLETGVPWKQLRGLVTGHSLVPASRLDGSADRTALIAGALDEARMNCAAAARALGADLVLGLRIDQGPVPAGDDGLDWCVFVLGTAVSRS